jgi:hypothetical protein
MSFYGCNIYGQLYNLKNPEQHIIDDKKINGLIRRTNNQNYNSMKSPAVDKYIYKYLMTPEQQSMCGRTLSISGWCKQITTTDDYADAIKTMCEAVYDDKFCNQLGDKEAERTRLLSYCHSYLAENQNKGEVGKKPSIVNDLQEKVNEIKNTPPPDKSTKKETDRS